MKIKSLFLIGLFVSTMAMAQQPFEKYGYKVKVSTLSRGKYIEDFTSDSLVQVGSVMINRVTGKIASFITYDTVYSEATLHPQLISRWMSVDPLANEYYNHSPYSFVMNNPIKYVDPDGKSAWIPGTDGKAVSYQVDGDGNVTWSANASADTKKIGNSMLRTEAGTSQLNSMISSDTKVNLELSGEVNIRKNEETGGNIVRYGETKLDGVTANADGTYSASEATVTVFEGTIKVIAGQEKQFGGKAGEIQAVGAEAAIGAIAAHESVHAVDPANVNANLQNQINGTENDIEKKPNQIEKKVYDQLKKKDGN